MELFLKFLFCSKFCKFSICFQTFHLQGSELLPDLHLLSLDLLYPYRNLLLMWLVVFLYIDLFNMILYILIHIERSNGLIQTAKESMPDIILNELLGRWHLCRWRMLVIKSVGWYFHRFFREDRLFNIWQFFSTGCTSYPPKN